MDDTTADRWLREQPHQSPAQRGRVGQRRHRSPEPDCPDQSNLAGIPEKASPASDQSLRRSASSNSPMAAIESPPRESHEAPRFHTWGNSGIEPYSGYGNQLSGTIDE